MDTVSNTSPANVPTSFAATGQASAAAMMRSSQMWAAGYKTFGEIMSETVKGYFDQTTSAWQAMSRATTLKEAVDLQTGYIRDSSEHSAACAKKLVEATNHLTHEAMSSIVERLASISPASMAVSEREAGFHA